MTIYSSQIIFAKTEIIIQHDCSEQHSSEDIQRDAQRCKTASKNLPDIKN